MSCQILEPSRCLIATTNFLHFLGTFAPQRVMYQTHARYWEEQESYGSPIVGHSSASQLQFMGPQSSVVDIMALPDHTWKR